jgi:hypothetical protein
MREPGYPMAFYNDCQKPVLLLQSQEEAAVAATLASASMHDDAASKFETRLEHAVQALIAEVQT